jgi:hypothetical protein
MNMAQTQDDDIISESATQQINYLRTLLLIYPTSNPTGLVRGASNQTG